MYINKDFCETTLKYRKMVWTDVKRLCEELDLIFYLQYCSFVQLITPDTNFESIFFNPFSPNTDRSSGKIT